jgi:serine-type D-Ala-D-Ala carboxypeptidase (penicillin-binding protein 5/6)
MDNMRYVLSFFVALYASAAIAAPRYDSTAPIAYLVDMSSGTILFEKGAKKAIPPASMAKMMTVYVAFDLIARRRLNEGDRFRVKAETWKKWNNTGSNMFLRANEQVSVADLLHGVTTLSGNDAAVTLAEGISGNEAAFVEQMNATAKRLGMANSKFATASGWPDGGRTITTAQDLAVLGKRTIHDFPDLYRRYYNLRQFRWNGISQINRNPLLGRMAGADGIKTGHTNQAGYCLTGTAERNGRRLLMVVAGLPSATARTEESLKLLRWGFDAWQAQKLFRAQSVVAMLPVQLGRENRIAVMTADPLVLTLPAKDAPRYKLFVRYTGPVKAPIKRGTELAQLVARFENGQEKVMPLFAAKSVGRAGFLERAWNGAKLLFGV